MRQSPRRPIVDLYCLCWNEAAIIPHFLRHYERLVRRFVVFDNKSTDGSLALLEAHPQVQTASFTVQGESFVQQELDMSNGFCNAGRQDRDGPPNWVLIVDMDEFLFHADLPAYLQSCTDRDVTAIRAIGYDMVSDGLPDGDAPLPRIITRGERTMGYDKPFAFAPGAIGEPRFTPGRHGAYPTGRVVWPARPEVALLHYKHLGAAYSRRRNTMLRGGLKPGDLAKGWGSHYLRTEAEVDREFRRLNAAATVVPGLPGGPPRSTLGVEEHMIRAGGRFAASWYLATYPDVASYGLDPIAHFHHRGWRESRRPHPDCDPRSYLAGLDPADPSVRNPYFAYLTRAGPARGAPISLPRGGG